MILWASLLLIATAELLIILAGPAVGLSMHAILLMGLILRGVLGEPGPERRLTLALVLAPLIRLLSLSLPLATIQPVAWYPIVSLPVLIVLWKLIPFLGLSRRDLGLSTRGLVPQLALAGAGVGLGSVEYMILQPGPLSIDPSWSAFLAAGLAMVLFTGFAEELIFRGLILSVAFSALGRWAIIYVSALFAAMHIPYISVAEVPFAFIAAALFAVIARYSGSIIGVSLAHGTANVTLFLLMPFWMQQPAELAAETASWAIWGGTAIAVVGAATITRAAIILAVQRAITWLGDAVQYAGRRLFPAPLQRESESIPVPVQVERAPVRILGPASGLFLTGRTRDKATARPDGGPSTVAQPGVALPAAAAAPAVSNASEQSGKISARGTRRRRRQSRGSIFPAGSSRAVEAAKGPRLTKGKHTVLPLILLLSCGTLIGAAGVYAFSRRHPGRKILS